VTAEVAPAAGVVAAAVAVLGAEAAVDAVLRATAVAWGAGVEAALGADETADIGIANSKIWQTRPSANARIARRYATLHCGE
jgi:hypothetical protein